MQRTCQASRYGSINAIRNRSGNKAHGNRNIGHDDSQDILVEKNLLVWTATSEVDFWWSSFEESHGARMTEITAVSIVSTCSDAIKLRHHYMAKT